MNLVIPATRESWQIRTLKGVSMDPKRQGEIALKLVKHLLRKRGVTLGNVAKAIEVPVEELKQFAKPLMQEILDECFSVKQ